MAKLGTRQRYHLIVPALRIMFEENHDLAIAVRGTLQKMVARGRITERTRETLLECIPINLPLVKNKPKGSPQNKAAKVVGDLFSPSYPKKAGE